MMKIAINKLIERENLTDFDMETIMAYIMEGRATPAQIGSFITALRIKGETIDEITGAARAMRSKAEKIHVENYCIDTCGTGGDGAQTFNISTITALITAAARVPVAKHGNRSVSSRCGSADVLENLGVIIDLPIDRVKMCIESIGICFMFAPNFHRAMKYAAQPRKELGIRTIFNILGPLTNPAGVKGQVLGVFNSDLIMPMASVLSNLGVERGLVVCGDDGLDELTITAKTRVAELKNGVIMEYSIEPEELGLKRHSLNDIRGGSTEENCMIIKDILLGEKGPKRDIVLLNAGAAMYVGKAADSIKEGIKLAGDIIDSGMAYKKLQEFIECTEDLVS